MGYTRRALHHISYMQHRTRVIVFPLHFSCMSEVVWGFFARSVLFLSCPFNDVRLVENQNE